MRAGAQDLTSSFAASLRAIGGNARVVRGGAAAAAAIEQIVRREQADASVLYEPFAAAEELGLPLALRARGIRLEQPQHAGGRTVEFRVGLTGASLAIAESGTLLVGGNNGGWGLVTVLPWVHIAVLRAGDIAADLPDAFSRFRPRFESGERNWVWISGPSKTADIAKTLVTGIHGPNALEVLIVPEKTTGTPADASHSHHGLGGAGR